MVKDTIVESILAKFKQDLNQVEKAINRNNDKCIISYLFLKPLLVLNSIII